MFCDFPKYKHLKQTIYRGPGGGGNADSDAEVNQLAAFALEAENSAIAAAASAAEAAGSEADAIAAAASAAAALVSQNAAASSAASALSSKNSAETAKTAAELAETNAETAQTAAQLAETNAETAETNAELAETNAEAAQVAAEAAKVAAQLAETNAETAEANAEVAQAAAELAETNAETAASAAAASASSAAASYDSFDDRYLGAKSADPTLDNDGNALLTGALYWNTVSNQMRAYSGSAWIVSYLPADGYVQKTGDTMSGSLSVTGTVTATTFSGAGTSLTGTASALSIGGNAATATTATNQSGGTVSATSIAYSTTLTGGTGVVNLGSGQVYKDASGNLGIGTSSPTAPLHVNSASNPQIKFGGSSAAYYWAFDREDSAGDFAISNANGGAETERMRITASGNVGIGTSSPTNRLQLSSTGNPGLVFDGTNQGTDLKRIRIVTQIAAAGDFAIQSMNDAGSVKRTNMYIDASGNVLVGQTSQTGAEKVGISFDRTGSWGLAIKNTSSTAPNNATYVQFYYASTNTGGINSTGTTTSYNTTSDYRLKENVQPMVGALAKITALKPVTYKWKSTGEADEGFIAHELQAVCPSAVTGEKDAVDAEGNPQYQGIDTSFLVATLTAAIQELKAIVDAQGAEIAALKAI